MRIIEHPAKDVSAVRDTTTWTCDECHQVIGRPYYMGEHCFCSQRCREDFRNEMRPHA